MPVKDIYSLSKDELIEQYVIMRNMLDEKSKQCDQLKAENHDLTVNYNEMKLKYDVEHEKYLKIVAAKYQSQKNKIIIDMPTLFDDAEETAAKTEEDECEYIEVEAHKRKKRVPKEKHIDYSSLRHEIVYAPVEEGEDICEYCGNKMKIKKYNEEEELVVVPFDAYIRVTRIPVYECDKEQSPDNNWKSYYKIIPHRQKLFLSSKCSPETLAYIIDMKYSAGLPLEAIEKQCAKHGVTIPKQNMCNWVLGSDKYIDPLYKLMKADLMKLPGIHGDETHTQVLNEEGKPATSTSYMWVYHSPKMFKPIVLYDYEASRSGECAQRFLKGFDGNFLTTDGYDGYNKVDGVKTGEITRSMCNVHALRNFKDAFKLLGKGKERAKSEEAKAIHMYQEIFDINNKIEDRAAGKYSEIDKRAEYIQKCRQTEVRPKFDAFLTWLESIEPHCGRYTMKKAINYVLGHRTELTAFTDNGYIAMDNSICERAIRPFVVIRNRCKFYVSTTGADVSAKIYSLMITCEQNHINPYAYFLYIFEKLPNMDMKDTEALRALLPYSDQLPSSLHVMSKSEIKQILAEDASSHQA